MKIELEKEQKTIEISFNGSVLELLDKLGVNRETVIVVRNNDILDENSELKDGNSIKILSVVSGG